MKRFHFYPAGLNESHEIVGGVLSPLCFPANWSGSLAPEFAPRPVLIKKQSGTVIGFRDASVMNGMFLSWKRKEQQP
jgi:hypothetical protein